jgi:hypothetical protein
MIYVLHFFPLIAICPFCHVSCVDVECFTWVVIPPCVVLHLLSVLCFLCDFFVCITSFVMSCVLCFLCDMSIVLCLLCDLSIVFHL